MVLQITPTGENIRELLTEHFGMQSVLFRKSAKLGLSSQPDLFDDLECTLSMINFFDMPFIREWEGVLENELFLARDHKISLPHPILPDFFH